MLGGYGDYTVLDISIDDLLRRSGLQKRRVPHDGHCLLHAWSDSTRIDEHSLRHKILQEFYTHRDTYQKSGIMEHQLIQYLDCPSGYKLDTIEPLIRLLCNACKVRAFVFGEKYHYPTSGAEPFFDEDAVEIKRFVYRGWPASRRTLHDVLLLKTGENFDSLTA